MVVSGSNMPDLQKMGMLPVMLGESSAFFADTSLNFYLGRFAYSKSLRFIFGNMSAARELFCLLGLLTNP